MATDMVKLGAKMTGKYGFADVLHSDFQRMVHEEANRIRVELFGEPPVPWKASQAKFTRSAKSPAAKKAVAKRKKKQPS